MSDEDNVVPIKKEDPPLTEAEVAAATTRGAKVKKHARKHKKKYAAGSAVAVLIALLEAWPHICPLVPFRVQCEAAKPLAEFGATKLKESQDANPQ